MPTFFLSDLFFRNPVRQDYSFPEEPRFTDNFARTLVRGLLVEKLEKDIAAKALQFQFNPTNITDKKTQNYFDRTRTGSATPDTVWVSGNPQKLSCCCRQ